MNRRLIIVLAILFLALLAALPAASQAYVLSGRPWPDDVITYRADDARAVAATRFAARAWNRAQVGVRFRRVGRRADVVVVIGGSRCEGEATVGRTRGGYVRIGSCVARLQSLVATHEFGHVIGLGHENRRCALMNSYLLYPTGTPARCNVRSLSFWLASPLRVDDVRGARALTR